MRRAHGLTLIELLVALAIFTVVLGVAVTFFAQHAQDTARVQEKNELQDRVRLVMQLITQDLSLAGSSRYVRDGAVRYDTRYWVPCAPDTPCLRGVNDPNGKDTFEVRYHTSLRPPGKECRVVGYNFDGDTLRRADVPCSTTNTLPPPASAYMPLADGIVALEIRYVCEDGHEEDTPQGCAEFVRAALVRVTGQSAQGRYTFTLEERTPIRNLKTDQVL
ncbi:PilW family protein [Marinithermus hydrothermalis]|uniref:Prepilin-type N-terminal cleavage/methylation domain-containing protein n=1 Tax=Marinithermus hydrothermalis (strain DSM 14884 / JCM 11576 / T1) TaxID=869210 RepID=F2NL46_MARHT|nr:prepilin-type N-terminal cleavage/methylation domain-containing protein [Marinithermus hydrothermalis]AEB11449.1 hypothetical protein Marky_0699 [Marinithermus hydrothermalis DSM 14884]